MRKAVLRGFLVVIIVALLLCSVLFAYAMSKSMLSQTKQDMLYCILLMDYSLDYNNDIQKQIDNINPIVLDKTTRITIMDENGRVIADTSKYIDYNENHNDRPEFKEALENRTGVNIRYSETDKKNLLYTAYHSQKSDYIIRLSIPYNGAGAYIRSIIPAITASIIFAFLAAFIFAERLAKSITEPLREISTELLKIQNENESLSLKQYKYDEIDGIAKTVKILSDRIDENVEWLKYEKNKTDYILDNMSEGLILIDENRAVLTINKAAMEILECKKRYAAVKNIVHYTQNMQILEGLNQVLSGERESFFDMKAGEAKTFCIHITKIKKGIFDKAVGGAIVLMIDVSAERENYRIRQEFFSNASHELKTPITSIQGYSELLTSGIEYDKEQKNEFLKRIKNEAQNMTVLINDILMISRLEAGTHRENITEISVKGIMEDIIKTNEPLTRENAVSVSFKCGEIKVMADYNQIYQLFNNLFVNALKYNKPMGSVEVTITDDDKNMIFTIKDTGIGIPAEAQQRVFERFYRVDKGRSKKMGGTGLGLAIVKHIVNFYKGKIELKSKLEQGTEIVVTIPGIVK